MKLSTTIKSALEHGAKQQHYLPNQNTINIHTIAASMNNVTDSLPMNALASFSGPAGMLQILAALPVRIPRGPICAGNCPGDTTLLYAVLSAGALA